MSLHPQRRVMIETPDGLGLDVTDRLETVGSLTEGIEEDMTHLVHGDIDLQLADEDGEVESLVELAEPGEQYTVTIERESGLRRPKWHRVFRGILDLPWSLSFDRKEKTTSLQVFTLSKLLEFASAEGVTRTYTGETGTVTASSDQVTISDTTGLEAGDEITLTDANNEETQTIESVDSGVLVTTVDTWVNTFSGADLTLETPYYRDKSIQWLAEQLFDEAGLDDYEIDIEQIQAERPFASIAESDAADDWTAYDVRPSHDFTLDIRNPVGNDWELWLQDNGVDVRRVDNFTDTIGVGYEGTALSYDHFDDTVWITLKRDETNYEKLLHTPSGGGSQTNVIAGVGSGGWGTLNLLFEEMPTMAFHPLNGAHFKRYDVYSKILLYTPPVPYSFAMGSCVVIDNQQRASAVYTNGGASYVRVWTLPSWTIEGSYKISNDTGVKTGSAYDTGNEIVSFGQAGSNYYIVSRTFSGIIAYADFEGLSVAGALKELAILSGAYLTVDHYGTGYLRARSNMVSSRLTDPLDVGTPLAQQVLHLTELYKASVIVTGETPDGDEIKVVLGDGGDSAHQLEIDSKLITNAVLADAIGNTYLQMLSTQRQEEEVTVQETGELVRPLTQVVVGTKAYDVLEARTDLDRREQDLRLVEVA